MNPEDQARIVAIAKKWWPERQPYQFDGVWWWTRETGLVERIPDFLRDWAAMGLLLERMRELGFDHTLRNSRLVPDHEECDVWMGTRWYEGRAATLPEAVAAAAEAVPQDEIEKGDANG